jgi:hypothetical protein
MIRYLRNALLTLGVIATFLAVMPSTRAEAGITPTLAQSAHLKDHPEDMPRAAYYVFGWVQSPLISYHSECTLTDEHGRTGTVGRCNRLEVGWLSWSSLTLAIGGGLFWAAGKLKCQG